MCIVSLYAKAKKHMNRCITEEYKRLRFCFYYSFVMATHRIPIIPTDIVKKKLGNWKEQYLEKYMVPKHNGCFIDIGAHVGWWTFFMASKGIEVHAFEPSPQSYPILAEKAKKYSSIHVYPVALGQECRDSKLMLHSQSGHDSLVKVEKDFSGKQALITIRTLDSFQFHNIGLIKIDTEQYEVPILLGATRTISVHKPRLIIEIHRPYKEQRQKITKILQKLGYVQLWYGKPHARQHLIADPKEVRL